jgi:hypothetical protein
VEAQRDRADMKRRFLPAAGVAAALGLGLGGVASETISIGARPTVLRWGQTTMISGGIGSGQSGVDVYLESQACAEGKWELVAGPHTDDAGRFAIEIGGGVNRLVRARVEGATSNVLTIGQRPSVTLQQRPPGSFRVHVNAMRPLWRKRVVLQRYDASIRNWRNLRTAVLAESGSNPGSPFVWARTGTFRQQVAKGTLLRATLPLAQAKPCYFAGYSNLLRR